LQGELVIKLKRAYESSERSDGERILVERLWPRGLTKARAKIDLWLREIAPSAELRTWYGHDPKKWSAFRRRYTQELAKKNDLVRLLKQKSRGKRITFVYAARDEEHNSALLLRDFLSRQK
jgi:uncharacterized protein YeaO (DUF488 family)